MPAFCEMQPLEEIGLTMGLSQRMEASKCSVSNPVLENTLFIISTWLFLKKLFIFITQCACNMCMCVVYMCA